MNRRFFLSQASSIAAISGVPHLWQRSAAAAEPGPDEPILVVVELTGGNDGLNTVVPYRDDAYHRARPTLRVAPQTVLKLDDHLGLHPALKAIHGLWSDGKLRVVTNVGYPKPSRSHTRAMEIWQSGGLAPQPTSGWIGRASDHASGHSSPPCFVGSGSTPLAVRGRTAAPLALASIDGVTLRPGAHLDSSPHGPASDPAVHVARAMDAARVISGKASALRIGGKSEAPEGLDARLTTIRGLIASGLGTRVYYTSLDGFDTHANQQYHHDNLLRRLSSALAHFQKEIEASNLDDRVVILVFSEFGRRNEENGSKGTDHGAAGPVLLLGSAVVAGVLGGAPDLGNPDGDPRFTVDFRDLYAAVLADWLRVDPAPVLGRGKDESIRLFEA